MLNEVILHIQHRMSHAPSLLFLSHLSTTSLSLQSDLLPDLLPDLHRCYLTFTPVRPSSRPSARPSSMSASHGGSPCADPSNVSFGPLTETHSPTGYEPKYLTEEHNFILVKPMFFHGPSMSSTYESAESIATLPAESDWDDEQIRNMLASPLYLQEREVSADRSRLYHSSRENSVSSSSHFRESAGKLAAMFAHKRKSSEEILSDREGVSSGRQPVQVKDETLFRFSGPEEAARLVLEEQRGHQLAEAKSELSRQE